MNSFSLSLKPSSIFQLTVLGFVAVVAPLIIGMLTVARQLDSLSQDSQSTISAAADVMRISRALIEQTSSLERNARQYAVLGDMDLLELYAERREIFAETLVQLEQLGVGGSIGAQVEVLRSREEQTFISLHEPPETMDLSNLPLLASLVQSISAESGDWIDQRVDILANQANSAQESLRMLGLVLIGVSVLMALTFILLITRPLRQIDKAIHQLGSGGLNQKIAVSGPQDLQELGERLDWLRMRLSSLEQQRSRFMQRVSHELKTPLAAIQEGTALLNDGVVGPLSAPQAELAAILAENCRRLLKLIENLLRNRVDEVGSVQAMLTLVRLDKVVEGVVDDHRLALQTHQVEVKQRCSRLEVRANREQLRVVIDNLLSNAIKYSPAGGSIYLELLASEGRALFSILDQGPGIDPDDESQIFEAFYQGAPAPDGTRGSGLGLAIVQEYLQMNGGQIRLLNSSGGAHFEVQLPLAGERE